MIFAMYPANEWKWTDINPQSWDTAVFSVGTQKYRNGMVRLIYRGEFSKFVRLD